MKALLIVLIIAGCSLDAKIYFCAKENCLEKMTEMLALGEAYCALYRADASIFSGDEKVVADRKAGIGGAIKRNSSGLMHNKYCIVNNRTVITGSFNPVKTEDYNDLVIINSSRLARLYLKDFARLQGRKAGKSGGQAVFCPEQMCAERVRKEIRKAKSHIYFASYSFTHPGIANELILKSQEGITIRGIMEKTGTGSKSSKYAAMAASGIPIRLEATKKVLHYKFFVIDNRTVLTGSFNPTENGDKRNDENILIIKNEKIAKIYANEFLSLAGE